MSFFPENTGLVNWEDREPFHQDVSAIEQRYQGRWELILIVETIGALLEVLLNPLPEESQMHQKNSAFPIKTSLKVEMSALTCKIIVILKLALYLESAMYKSW